MWIVNCILLVIGTVAAVCGISFYIRNKAASSHIRFYILAYGISSAVWCIFFGLIGFCDDFAVCNILRKLGDLGVIGFLITEAYLVTDVSGTSQKIARLFRGISVVTGIVDYLAFSQDNVDTFVREGVWTTWVPDPARALNRSIHSAYVVLTFLILFSFALLWLKNNKAKRLRRFLLLVFAANFNILFFSIPDTLLPAFGRSAIPTSGIGGAVCAIVMWYGATELGSFDIRTGNIKERLFDFIETGVIVLDVDRKVSMMNRYSGNCLKSLETPRDGLRDFFDLSEEEEEKAFRSSADEVYAERLWSRDRDRAYSVRLSAVKDNFREIFCYLCVFVDVTEEVDAVKKFEIASQAKSRFLAQMSHEIRTPINAVLGMNEMILRESEDEEILSYAGNIDSAGTTLLSLINSILDFSKIEDGKMEIVPVQYDTAGFINDLYQSIIQRADAKGLAFVMDVDGKLPCTLRGDDVRFSQVIMNLLTNAVKYTEKGSVTLSLKVSEKRGEKLAIAVSVKDTGIGIREEDRERLFESFERLDEVRNHSIEGTGLGISIVTNLLALMGSELRVDSIYGEGSVFSFEIEQQIIDDTPIGDYEKRLKESKVRRNKEDIIHAPGARILVVDDNDMNLKVAKNLLKLCGIKSEEAVSGEKTIEYMSRNTYDIVFLDHMMPGMDGIETLHRLTEAGLVPDETVMIALTANAVVGAREIYLNEGFADYLSKPIEIKNLVELLRKYLPGEAYQQPEGQEPGQADQTGPGTKDAGPAGPESQGADPTVSEAKVADQAGQEAQGDNQAGSELQEPGQTGQEESRVQKEGKASDDDTGIMDVSRKEAADVTEYLSEEEKEPDTSANKGTLDRESLQRGGIDADLGMSYCGGESEIYELMLTEFSAGCEDKAKALDAFLEQKDWHGYKIAVHGAKSNARMIGAVQVSEMAKALEDAAQSEEETYINENHDRFLVAYRRIAEIIREGLGI